MALLTPFFFFPLALYYIRYRLCTAFYYTLYIYIEYDYCILAALS